MPSSVELACNTLNINVLPHTQTNDAIAIKNGSLKINNEMAHSARFYGD